MVFPAITQNPISPLAHKFLTIPAPQGSDEYKKERF